MTTPEVVGREREITWYVAVLDTVPQSRDLVEPGLGLVNFSLGHSNKDQGYIPCLESIKRAVILDTITLFVHIEVCSILDKSNLSIFPVML